MNADLSRIPPFYHKYANLIDAPDMKTAFSAYTERFMQLLSSIPTEKHLFRYAEGKWSIKELLLHISDAERIFAFRALSFARGDKTPLPGFEENDYAVESNADARSWDSLVNEFLSVRKATETLFLSFNEDQLNRSGTANNNSIYVEGLGIVLLGHAEHHAGVIREKYL